MNEELRAMTLSLAVTWATANPGCTVEDVIAAAKQFQNHIQFGGLT